ncbi:hypothetical protein [Melittangium boletus]|uniref:Uncharacterized protein n=1 Tax=Melittangium boletus DSM 14713 TaxID=1294270 RepID=A0A250I992_9BACT|nr:hypothetical protein [Melittangium boletus]ATB27783.1 hypothetical protein MEBOL_001228 [Melittangium boletus DSM 14713]
MTKATDQASGVVAGTLDISTQGEQDVAQPTDAGAVLARRKLAGARGQKAAARAKKPQARRTASASGSRQKR